VSGELILGAETDSGRRRNPRRRREVEEESLDYERRMNDRRLASTVCEGVGFYWKYEKLLRRLETEVGSMLGATGAIYALRRSLWRSLPPGTILDDVLAPMRAVLAGRRIVFEPAARAFDYTSPDVGAESRRKVRTLAGNVQILWFEPRLLVPTQPRVAAVRLHKIGRLLVPYALMALFASSIALSERRFYAFALFAQVAFYLHGGTVPGSNTGWRWRRRPALFSARAQWLFIVAMNVSAVAGWSRAVRPEGVAMISGSRERLAFNFGGGMVPSRHVVEAAIARENRPTFATAVYNEPRDWGYAGLLAFTTVLA
jgi:hypothetical protein